MGVGLEGEGRVGEEGGGGLKDPALGEEGGVVGEDRCGCWYISVCVVVLGVGLLHSEFWVWLLGCCILEWSWG